MPSSMKMPRWELLWVFFSVWWRRQPRERWSLCGNSDNQQSPTKFQLQKKGDCQRRHDEADNDGDTMKRTTMTTWWSGQQQTWWSRWRWRHDEADDDGDMMKHTTTAWWSGWQWQHDEADDNDNMIKWLTTTMWWRGQWQCNEVCDNPMYGRSDHAKLDGLL